MPHINDLDLPSEVKEYWIDILNRTFERDAAHHVFAQILEGIQSLYSLNRINDVNTIMAGCCCRTLSSQSMEHARTWLSDPSNNASIDDQSARVINDCVAQSASWEEPWSEQEWFIFLFHTLYVHIIRQAFEKYAKTVQEITGYLTVFRKPREGKSKIEMLQNWGEELILGGVAEHTDKGLELVPWKMGRFVHPYPVIQQRLEAMELPIKSPPRPVQRSRHVRGPSDPDSAALIKFMEEMESQLKSK